MHSFPELRYSHRHGSTPKQCARDDRRKIAAGRQSARSSKSVNSRVFRAARKAEEKAERPRIRRFYEVCWTVAGRPELERPLEITRLLATLSTTIAPSSTVKARRAVSHMLRLIPAPQIQQIVQRKMKPIPAKTAQFRHNSMTGERMSRMKRWRPPESEDIAAQRFARRQHANFSACRKRIYARNAWKAQQCARI